MADPVDLSFVTTDVWAGSLLQWADTFTDITDMVNKAIAKLKPGQCIHRLIIVGHGADHTEGYFVFDPDTAGIELIDGGVKKHPVNPDSQVTAQLKRLRPYLCPDAVIEFRVCKFGAGDNGARALQAIADATGAAVTAPTDSISSAGLIGGLCTKWRVTYPTESGLASVISFWRAVTGTWRAPTVSTGADVAPVTAQYVPLRDVPPPPQPPPPGTPAPTVVPTRPNVPTATKVGVGVGGAVVIGAGAGLGIGLGGGGSTPAPGGAALLVASASTTASTTGSTSTTSSPTTTTAAPPTQYPAAITAYFSQGAFSTYYTEPVSEPGWSYTWSVSVTPDPPCGQGFKPGTPTAAKATWYHADTSEGGPCNHSGQDYNQSVGHPGTVSLVVTPADHSWRCELLFYGTAPNNQDPAAPAVGNKPECQKQ